ncbi:MAG: hypothetical protein RL292_156 [Candidatus Parcubacteria bacterium]|jgi:hypothetical protein
MRIVPIRPREEWRVLYMRRLVGVCHACGWREERMVNPQSQTDIEEVRRLIRVVHATKTTCPFEPTIV